MAIRETSQLRPVTPREFAGDLRLGYALNGLAAFTFSCTAPVAIIIAVASAGGLSERDIASWIFGAFVFGGLLTLIFTLLWRQPLSFAWTIPGTVLLSASFDHLAFAEIIGAYLATGVLMTLLGCSGWIGAMTRRTPLPIVMAMVAGVFLSFVVEIVLALQISLLTTASMVTAYIVTSMSPRVSRVLPPVVAALICGALVVVATGQVSVDSDAPALLTWPQLYRPVFSWPAMLELVLPLAVTVLAAQNAQGFAILSAAGHRPPINTLTIACGVGSWFNAFAGSVCACVTGPSNAILASYGERNRQYTGAVVYGVLSILFGLCAQWMTWLALLLPGAFIATLGGLGVLRVLQNAFVTAFATRFTLGAAITFVVTVSDLTVFNIGAPFWGLVAGVSVSLLLERDDFQALTKATDPNGNTH